MFTRLLTPFDFWASFEEVSFGFPKSILPESFWGREDPVPINLSFLASYFWIVFWCSSKEDLNWFMILNYLNLIMSDAVLADKAKF
jgi:hypothetical protein